MATIGDFFSGRKRKAYVAAQQGKDKTLYYCESDSLRPFPPSVHVWAYVQSQGINAYRGILTNYPKTWVSTYGAWEGDYRDKSRFGVARFTAIPGLDPAPWAQFGLSGLGPPPNLNSLYDDFVTYGTSRARRVYLLAAFSILKKHGRKFYGASQGHNIGSILVGNDGELLSWGVNTGGFCHAEVNTIVGYFAKHPTASRLPAKSVLFTTLKPCLMCSTLITEAQHTTDGVKAWYGMTDEGKQGGTQLLGNRSADFQGIVDLDFDFDVMAERGMTTQAAFRAVQGTKRVNVGSGKAKEDLTSALDASGGGHKKRGMSAADWVDSSKEVWRLVEASVTKLQGKADKQGRDDGPMKATLSYLKGWALS